MEDCVAMDGTMATSDRNTEFEDCLGVFQGGGCRAAAYAGAYSALVKHGVNLHELAGASAGAIAAVLIAAGAEPEWLEQKLADLDFFDLVAKPEGGRWGSKGRTTVGRLWNLARFNGIHSSAPLEEWLERNLREVLGDVVTSRVRFCDLPKPVSVIAADLNARRPIVWSSESSPEYSVADAVRASCSIPFFFQPHRGSYADGGMISNLPLHLLRSDDSEPRRILALRLVDAPDLTPRRSLSALLSSVASTVVDGGQQVESGLIDHVSPIYIPSGEIRATDFDKMTTERVRVLVEAGRQAVDDFFARGNLAAAPIKPPSVSTHRAQTLTMAADLILRAQVRILIAAPRTDWVFDLYGSLLAARMRGVAVAVCLPEYAGPEADVRLQRDTLRALGCSIVERPADQPLAFEGWVCDPETYNGRAVILSKSDLPIDGRSLTVGDGDEKLINLIASAVEPALAPSPPRPAMKLLPAPLEAVADVLQRVEQYSTGQEITLESIPLSKVDAWARYAHVYKQRQQEAVLRLLRRNDFEEYDPYYVDYGDGTLSLAMPAVVEASRDGRFTVVNGVSRLIALHRERSATARVAVVRGVTAPPPAADTRRLSDLGVRVGIRGKNSDRYPGFVYANMRHVEKPAHHLLSSDGREGAAG